MLKWRMAAVAVLVLVSSLIGVQASVAPVAQTGQTTSYRTGDDGDLQPGVEWPSPRFTDNGDTITDNLTGLMWAEDANIWGSTNWNGAIDNCNGLSLGGHDDWRLPTVNELQSLMDFSQVGPALPSGHPFQNRSTLPYWSSTTDASGTTEALLVSLWIGQVSPYTKTGSRPVWPVRGESTAVAKTGQTTSYRTGDDGDLQPGVEWPSPRFTDNGDTITDNLTGLMWAEDANIWGSTNWNAAIDNCNGLSLGGHDDWRLPTVKELQSLIDFSQYGHALPSGHPFLNVSGLYYWSSTTYVSGTSNAWYTRPWLGHVGAGAKTSNSFRYSWPVRGESTATVQPSAGSVIMFR